MRVPQLCTERPDHALLTCNIRPHPLPEGGSGSLKLTLDVKDLEPGTESVSVWLNVSSAGEELVAGDNVYNFTLGLKTEADIGVTGYVGLAWRNCKVATQWKAMYLDISLKTG